MAPRFARNDPNPSAAIDSVRFIAKGLRPLIDYLDDKEMQRCVGETVAKASVAALAPRQSGASILKCD